MVADEKTCRQCWGNEDDGPLVQPCACHGSAQWIHKACLEQWRRTSPREDAAYRCGQCRFHDALSLELLSARLQAERMSGQSTVFTLNTLAGELTVQGKYDGAELLYREALERQHETLGSRHPNTHTAINNLGLLLKAKGDLAAAEPLLREALEVRREILGGRHPETLTSINNLGVLLQTKGDLAAAGPLLREAVEVQRETLGSRHPSTLLSIGNLGRLMYAKGDLAATEPLYREALEVQRETRGNWHPSTLDSIHNLGALLVEKGKYEEAEPLCSEVLQAWRETLGNWHPNTLIAYRLYWLLPFKLAEKLYGPPLRWLCGARRFAVGTLVRLFGRRRASVAPAVD